MGRRRPVEARFLREEGRLESKQTSGDRDTRRERSRRSLRQAHALGRVALAVEGEVSDRDLRLEEYFAERRPGGPREQAHDLGVEEIEGSRKSAGRDGA